MDIETLALAKAYTKASLAGAGAVKGEKGDAGADGKDDKRVHSGQGSRQIAEIRGNLRKISPDFFYAFQHTEPNARGEDILRHEYDWGGRISEEEAESAGNARASGMVRMRDDSYKSGNHGTYFTFRVISAKSAAGKWIMHRHIRPHDVTGALKREFEQMIQQSVNDAFRADIGF